MIVSLAAAAASSDALKLDARRRYDACTPLRSRRHGVCADGESGQLLDIRNQYSACMKIRISE